MQATNQAEAKFKFIICVTMYPIKVCHNVSMYLVHRVFYVNVNVDNNSSEVLLGALIHRPDALIRSMHSICYNNFEDDNNE